MAGRTFRKTGYDAGRNQAGITSLENAADEPTGIVQSESTDGAGINTAVFEPTDDAQTVYTDGDGYPIDPTSITDTETGQPTRTRRTRADAGQKRGTRQKRVTFSSAGNLEKLLLSGHMMAAAFLKTPELRIDETEAAMLSKATLDVFKAYGIPELSDKQLAASQMLMALGTVYAPRLMLMYAKRPQKPRIVSAPIPFPSGAGKAVQDAQPPIPPPAQAQGQVAQPNTFGAAPAAPPENTNGFISSSMFAAADSAGLDTINAS
jgi:hypothetical protein